MEHWDLPNDVAVGTFVRSHDGKRRIAAFATCCILSACAQSGGGPSNPQDDPQGSPAAEPGRTAGDLLVSENREIIATATWDGRPTLRGLWITHPSAERPRRARITNQDTGLSIEGALIDNLTADDIVIISSDAARSLGMDPGQRTTLIIAPLRPEAQSARQSWQLATDRAGVSPPAQYPLFPPAEPTLE